MFTKNRKSSRSEFAIAVLGSTLIHSTVLALSCVNIFRPQPTKDLFLNIEIAGAAELQEALNEYKDVPAEPIQQTPQSEPEPEPVPEPKLESNSTPDPEPASEPQSAQETVIEDKPVFGPKMIENPEPEPEATTVTEPEIEELPPSENGLPEELQQEQQKRLEEEKKLQEEKEALRKKELQEKKLKKKRKEAARRRKKRLEALKKIQKRKSRKNRLSKIAEAVKKNNEAKKKSKDNAFDKMLKSEKKHLSTPRYKASNTGGFGNGLGSFGNGMGITDSDAAIISSQIVPHWVVAGGVKNAETLIIRIRIKVKNNGEVPASSIEIIDKDRYNSDKVFKSAADSAKRAILQASPLKIPADKMHLFRDFEFSFNTDKALGVKK